MGKHRSAWGVTPASARPFAVYATLLIAAVALLHAMLAPAQAAAVPHRVAAVAEAVGASDRPSHAESRVVEPDGGAAGHHGHGNGKAHAGVTSASGKARAGGPAPLPPALAVAPQLAPVPGRCGALAGADVGVPDWSSPRTVVLRC